MITKIRISLVLLSFIFIFSACKKTDNNSSHFGTIQGVIKATSGIPVQDATIKISAASVVTSTTTGADGSYSISSIVPQDYEMVITKSAYISQIKNVSVIAGETKTYDFTLESIITASQNSVVASRFLGSTNIDISSNVAWTATSSATWLSCTPLSGSGSSAINVSWSENLTAAQRQANITISGVGVSSLVISVTQLNIVFVDGDHLLMGNPSNATADINFPNNYLMPKPQYILSYNNSKHIPNWTCWYLSGTWMGDAPRQDDFRPDPAIPPGWYACDNNEYSGSGFDRGHMCPSADRTSSIPDNSATFLMTNMIPQAPKNNQQTWENLESYCRTLVSAGNELYIISGPYGQGGEGSNGLKNTVGNGIVVPSKVWKIIVVLPLGTNDLSRVTASTRVIAVVTPNTQSCSTQAWGYYRTSVNAIEALTGYDFLSNVPGSIQNIIEATVDNGSTN